jgi:hypothetical protein
MKVESRLTFAARATGRARTREKRALIEGMMRRTVDGKERGQAGVH